MGCAMNLLSPPTHECLPEAVSPLQQDLIQEMVNIGMGRAAGALNQMTGSHVELSAPAVRVVRLSTLQRHGRIFAKQPLDLVRLRFHGGFKGVACLLFTRDAGGALVRLLFGGRDAPDDLEFYRSDTLREIGNIILIWIMGAIGNTTGLHFEYRPLEYLQDLAELLPPESDEGMALMIKATFGLETALIQGDILLLFDGEDCRNLLLAVSKLAGVKPTC